MSYAFDRIQNLYDTLTDEGFLCKKTTVGWGEDSFPTIMVANPHTRNAFKDRAADTNLNTLLNAVVKAVEGNKKLSKILNDVQSGDYNYCHGEAEGTNKIALLVSDVDEELSFMVYLHVEDEIIRIGTYVSESPNGYYYVDGSAIWLWLSAANQLTVLRNQIPMMRVSQGSKYVGGATGCSYNRRH